MGFRIHTARAYRSFEGSMALALLRLGLAGIRRLIAVCTTPRRPRPERLLALDGPLSACSTRLFRTVPQAVADDGRTRQQVEHGEQTVRRAGFRLEVLILRTPSGLYWWLVLLCPCTVSTATMLTVVCPRDTLVGRCQLGPAARRCAHRGRLLSR